MVITREISVDVAKRNVFSAIVAKQNDTNSRFLKVTLTNLGDVITVPTAATVTINAEREDGNSAAFLGSANVDGTVTVPLTPWMLALDGEVKCDVSVVDSEGQKLTSTLFVLAVEAATYSGDSITENDSYDLLVALLAEVAETMTVEEQRVATEQSRVTAETQRVTAENDRQTNETSRGSAENDRVTAESGRSSAEEQRVQSETARVNAETARVQAEIARETASQTAVTNAENATASALAAAEGISLADRDTGKNYTYKFFVRDGYPGIELTEIPE